MKTNPHALIWIAALAALSLACSLIFPTPAPQTTESATNVSLTQPTLTEPASQPSPEAPIDRCPTPLPVYPGAQGMSEAQEEFEALMHQMETVAPSLRGDIAVYSTTDAPAEVIAFYESHPPGDNWTQTLDMTSEEGGIIVWEQDGQSAQVFVTLDDDITLILLGCGTRLSSGPITTSLVISTPLAGNVPPLDVSPDKLALTYFEVSPREHGTLGQSATVTFTLRNVSSHRITFEPPGVFVGCRWNATDDSNNCDFGHQGEGQTLNPGEEITLVAARPLDHVGTWRLWPAYRVNGRWGPFRWYEWVLQITEAPSEGWLLFSHPDADFTFRYPDTWVVTEAYIYETPGGARAEHLTVILRPRASQNPTDQIMINPRQPACEMATCVEKGPHWFVTYSDSPDVLSVFQAIVASFRETP